MRFMIVGAGGRECAFAHRLANEAELYAVLSHENPGIVDCVVQSGGQYTVGDVCDHELNVAFAKAHNIDYVFVNADDPLARGVVDALLENNIKAIGGTRDATRIEWDKVYAMEMLRLLCPEFTPHFTVVSDEAGLHAAIKDFESRQSEVVVKPQGLTGGKGVKVMPVHLPTYRDCADYAAGLLRERPGEKVLLVEKLDGVEFTIMGFTDGEHLVMSPASYDYPYRYEGDRGAGTGGMGCFTSPEKKLPFMSDEDWATCQHIMQSVLDELRKRGLRFTGVLNGGFFKTAKGIRFMELNSRFGDPEALNVLMVLKSSFSELLVSLWERTLSGDKAEFVPQASVVKYLVAADYPEASREATAFMIDKAGVARTGAKVFFATCVKDGDEYRTLKKSRVLAVGALADTVPLASDTVNAAIDAHIKGALEFRRDIGSGESLEDMMRKA